jgi:hypothetical protein
MSRPVCGSRKSRRKIKTIDSDPPSEEEAELMRAKWETFFDAVKDVYSQGFEIADEISMASS